MTPFQTKRNAAIAAEMQLRDTLAPKIACNELDIVQVGTHVQITLTAEQAIKLAALLKGL